MPTTTAASAAAGAASTSYGGGATSSSGFVSSSWDDHYRRKGRTRERFLNEFIASDEYDDDHDYDAGQMNAQQRRRPQQEQPEPLLASAVTYQPRPFSPAGVPSKPSQGPGNSSRSSGSTTNQNKYQRAAFLNTMFYPTEGTTEMTPTGAQVSGLRDETAVFMVPGDPYQSTIGRSPQRQRGKQPPPSSISSPSAVDPSSIPYQHQSYSSTPRRSNGLGGSGSKGGGSHRGNDQQQQYYNYVKENLIMFGDAPTASTGTGLSQEELLQRKKREDSWRRRKERRQHQPKKVQLPSSLLFTGTSSSSSPTKVDRSSGHTRSTHDTAAAVVAPPPAISSSTRSPDNGSVDEFGLPSFFNNGVGMNEYKQHRTTSSTAAAARTKTARTSSSPSKSNYHTPTTSRVSGTNMGTGTKGRKKSLDHSSGLNCGRQEDGKGVRFTVDLETQGATSTTTVNNNSSKGSRSSMVRRQRGDKSSSGRRWKIVRVEEEPDGTTTNAENDKQQSPKADPPVEDVRSINGLPRVSSASSRAKVPMDPPSGSEHERDPEQTLQTEREPSEVITEVHSPSLKMDVWTNLQSKSSTDGSEIHSRRPQALTHPAKDEFDRFMDRPSLYTSGSPRRSRAFNLKDDASGEEYLTIIRDMNETPRLTILPSSTNFTPKSEYSRSLFASKSCTAKPSPTSVLDFSSPGVRWRETLTQEEFVTPESVKLYPDAPEKEKETIMGLPRSILRSGANKGRRGPDETDSQRTSNTHDCPSDESPRKMLPDRATRTLEVHTETEVYSEPLGDIGFLDLSGRSVSPIPGEGSLTTDDDVLYQKDGLLGHQRSKSDAIFEKNIPSEFQKAFLSKNPVDGENDDSGHISDSYVNFIEAVAAVVIQTKVRQHLATLRVCEVRAQMRTLQGVAEITTNREESRANVLRVATPRDRGSIAGASATAKHTKRRQLPSSTTKAEPAFDFFALAAIRVQAAFRGWWVRDCIAVDHYCATTIQKTYRGFVSRTRYMVSLYSIVMVQSIWRRQIAIRRVRSHEMLVLHMQHYYRAATKIQSLWRCFYCEMKFLRDYEDILLVQSIARGWIARRLIRSWLRAHETDTSFHARGAVKAASKRQERQQKQPSPSRPTTRGRTPSSRVDISPSYLHHIEYMRTQLASPRSSVDDVGPSFGETKPVGRQLFPTAKSDVRLHIAASSSKDAKAVDREMFNHEVPESQDVAPDDEIGTIEQCFVTKPSKETAAEQPAPAQNVARLEIEKRRKEKEVKAKALKEEENRRKEARAAELAELEMRRKRMALKAEARKREEATKTAVEATTQAVAERNNNADRFSHSEEKKESDSVSCTETPAIVPISTASSVETPSKAVDGAFGLLARWEKRSRGESVETPSPLASKPGPKTTEIIETLDDAEKFVSPFSPRFPGPVRVTEKPAEMETEETEANSKEDSALTMSDDGSVTNVEDVKMHRISQHAEAMDQPDAEGEPRIRVSGSAATYQAHMRSQRNKAEQQRIDQMHEQFKRAGIMNRVKHQRC